MNNIGVTAVVLILWGNGCSSKGDSSNVNDGSGPTEANSTSGEVTPGTNTGPSNGATSPIGSTSSVQTTRPTSASAPTTSDTTSLAEADSWQAFASDETRPLDASENSDETTTGTMSQPSTESETTSESSEPSPDVVDTGADETFSFFVTSYHHMAALSGSEDGFGGDLRYNGAATGLEGADAICQEIARRVGFGDKQWKAYLSTSTTNAIDRIGTGPWYDFLGIKVADSPQDLISGSARQPGGCCETGTYDELGLYHDGSTDQNNDGIDDDDHDTMTATLEDGTYAGFSCEDWTSTTATSSDVGGAGGGAGGGGFGGGTPGGGGGGGLNGGIMMGHSWPAGSGQHWATSHGGHNCAAGTNFLQNGPGDSSTVGGGGGYGGIYCFANAE